MTLPYRKLVLCLSVLTLCSACLRREPRKKAPTRTEPWPAPLVSAPTVGSAGRARYRVERSKVEVELTHRKRTERALLTELQGSIELDPVRLTETRAELRADLLSLSFTQNGEDSPDLTLRAFEVLGLEGKRDPAARDLDRFAILNITGFDRAPSDEATRATKTALTARGDLTLHHFRVPVVLELEVELDRKTSGNAAQRLLIRTRRPLVVSLAAHELVPNLVSKNSTSRDKPSTNKPPPEFGREARISAELLAVPESEPAKPPEPAESAAKPSLPKP